MRLSRISDCAVLRQVDMGRVMGMHQLFAEVVCSGSEHSTPMDLIMVPASSRHLRLGFPGTAVPGGYISFVQFEPVKSADKSNDQVQLMATA